MRIIGGRFKGRAIATPRNIRPTQDKVRKALFDILGEVKGLSFLDIYAGSGAVGLEAFSRGADRVAFVESKRHCAEKIKGNLAKIGLSVANCEIIGIDAIRAIKQLNRRKEKFDIIFLDPPYYKELAKKTLKILSQYDILTASGLIICQHFKKDALPESLNGLRLTSQSRYGDTYLSFYRKQQ